MAVAPASAQRHLLRDAATFFLNQVLKHTLEYFADHDELAAGFAASQVLCTRPWQSFKAS